MRALLLALLVVVAGCKKKEESRGARTVTPDAAAAAAPVAKPGERTIGRRVAAGSLRETDLLDAYAVLLPAGGDGNAVKAAVEAAAKEHHVAAEVAVVPIAESTFQPELLPYFGRELSDGDLAGLGKATHAVTIVATAPASAIEDLLHGAAAVARAGAVTAKGWIQDMVTSETFDLASFDARRPAGFPLDTRKLIVIHAVGGDDSMVFFETFGLSRFGLPELYLQGIPQSFGEDMLELVNAAAQTLVESGGLAHDGELAVNTAALQNGTWPAFHKAVVEGGGKGTVTFTATWSRGDDPDASDIVEIELGLPEGPMPALTQAFGAREDEVHMAADGDVALNAASARAKKELETLAPHFAGGIPEGEQLLVKAPFTTDDGGVEWMWVEVTAWKGEVLSGILVNRPSFVSTVKEGARVDVKQGDLFDYVHTLPDGSQTGGETNRILEGQ